MIRVLHIISGLGIGGAEAMLGQLVPMLQARGLPQHVVSLTGTGPVARRLEAARVPLTLLDLRRSAGRLSGLPRLAGTVMRFQPDVIQGWMYHGDLAATFAHWASGGWRNRRLMWGVRCSDMDLARHARLIRTEAWLSRWPDVIVANSSSGARVHLAHGYRPRRLEVIANGFDTERFRPDPLVRRDVRAGLGIGEEECVVVHVARVDPMKDHATLLRAVEGVPGLRLLLIGKGTDRLSPPANAIVLGRREDVPRLLPAADMVVSSSAFGEGFCNALGEGMCAGLAPVSTDVGDARVIVGETGSIVPPGDWLSLRRALLSLANLGPEGLRTAGLRARERIVAEFALARSVDRFAALYDPSQTYQKNETLADGVWQL